MTFATSSPEEVFVVPRGEDDFYLYAPLRRGVAVVNGAAVETVAAYLADQPVPPGPAAELIHVLEQRNLLGGEPPPLPIPPDDYGFCPHEVTLFPTTRCNLRCRYCYAEAGREELELPWETARAAIDLVAENAGHLGSPKFGVNFHGGGEPTVAWSLVVQCVEYAQRKAEDMGLEVELAAATNGVLNEAQRRFLTEQFSSVNVSLDGPPDIQDFNRPLVDGSGSYAEVARTLHYFDEVGFRYGIRVSVTAGMAGRLTEIVEALRQDFQFQWLHVEPIWQCGRCLTTGEESPANETFIAEFVEASRRGRELGINVHYSGARLDVVTNKFCAAPGEGFAVLPTGAVTSCYEVTDEADPRAAVFHYGFFDARRGEFEFDSNQIERLRGLSVDHLSHCTDCFCRWHCAGDCLAKALGPAGQTDHHGSARCELNRELTREQLEELVRGKLQDSAGTQPKD